MRDWIYDQEEVQNLPHTGSRSEPRSEDVPLDRPRPSHIILLKI